MYSDRVISNGMNNSIIDQEYEVVSHEESKVRHFLDEIASRSNDQIITTN